MPVTFATFGLGYLAIIGIPRSPVLHQGRHHRGGLRQGRHLRAILGTCAVLGAALTAFYMTRVMLMTWFGQRRWEAEAIRTNRRA